VTSTSGTLARLSPRSAFGAFDGLARSRVVDAPADAAPGEALGAAASAGIETAAMKATEAIVRSSGLNDLLAGDMAEQ